MSKQEVQYYKENCKEISSLTFGKIKENALNFITDSNTTPTGVVLFSEWLFNKIYYIWKVPETIKKDIFKNIIWGIENCKSIPIKMGYLQWRDVDFIQMVMHYFYQNRFDSSLFIEQMLNDSNLLRWSQNLVDEKELLRHFLSWIIAAPTFEQKSNLLDVLLRFFPNDQDVQSVYKSMMKGDTLYNNEQSAHDEDLQVSVKKVLKDLYFWMEEHKVYKASDGLTRSEWTMKSLSDFATGQDVKVIRGIGQRLAIDKTTFEIRDDTNRPINIDASEVLFMLVNYIMSFGAPEFTEIRKNMMKSLLEEMREAVELCISGYVMRFVNSIQGYGEMFQIKIPFRKQLHAKLNYDISNKMRELPETSNAILGTYDDEFKDEYFKFILGAVDIKALIEQYGSLDVTNVLPCVLNTITDSSAWNIENGELIYAL